MRKLSPSLQVSAMADTILTVTDDNFDAEVLQSKVPVLLDFWAPWCGPCQQLNPVIEALADEMGDAAKVAKVNVDDNRDLAVKLAVEAGIETVIASGPARAVGGVDRGAWRLRAGDAMDWVRRRACTP